MWTSIKHFEKPASLDEAQAQIVAGKKVIFGGGTYLVTERSPKIDTLISIQHLLDNGIGKDGTALAIGAGVTLQQLVQHGSDDSPLRLAECARFSCPSRNVRNQRTLGGEIGQQRANSELFTYLQALDARLEIRDPDPRRMSIREWDGEGIITAVRIDMADIQQTFCQRFALIPSAPAMVIVAGARRAQGLDVAVGGVTAEVTLASITELRSPALAIDQIAAQAAARFKADQHGSQAYKEQLIRTGLNRIVAQC